MFRSIVTFSLLFTLSCSIAQISQVRRFEKERENMEDYFTVIPVGNYGMLLMEDNDERKGKDEVWQLYGLDTSLKEMWNEEMSIKYNYEFRAYEQIENFMYLIFEEEDRSISDYRIVQIDITKGEIQVFEVDNEIEFEIGYIVGLKDQLILGGYVRFSPTLLSYKIGESKFSVVPGYFKDKSDIIDLRANDSQTFNILTMEKNYTGYFLRLRTYSFDSKILFEKEIELNKNYQIIDGYSLGFINGNIALAGTYGSASSKYVQGLFFALVKPNGQKNEMKYHDLSVFNHFFDYTSPRRAEHLEEKAENFANRGKELKVGVRLLMHDLHIRENGSYMLVADVYDPRYDTEVRDRYFYNPFYYMNDSRYLPAGRYRNGRYPDYRSYEETVKYDYESGFVVALSGTGDILWDNSIVIDDREEYSLHPIASSYAGTDSLYMIYKNENDIVHQSFKFNNDTTEPEYTPISTLKDTDDIRNSNEEIGETGFWYGNYFFVWGYQKINDRAVKGLDGKRDVLYINKISAGKGGEIN